jgi:hypothetical protein
MVNQLRILACGIKSLIGVFKIILNKITEFSFLATSKFKSLRDKPITKVSVPLGLKTFTELQ